MTMNLCSAPAFILMSCLFATEVHSKMPLVRQEPLFARLVEGQNVIMNCTIVSTGPKAYTWLKYDLEISARNPMYRGRVDINYELSGKQGTLVTDLRIRNLTECDSGTYYCREDSMGSTTTGGGTTITVTRASQSVQCSSINIIFIAVSAGVIAMLCISLIIVSVHLIQRNKACIALQRQFVAYVTEKSTESIPLNQKGKHKHREASSSSSGTEGKKKKRKPKQRNRMDPEYVHVRQPQEMLP